LLTLAGLLILAQRREIRLPGVPLLWLVVAVLSLALVLLYWVTLPPPNTSDFGRLGLNPADVSADPGWGLYLGLIAAAVSVLAAVFRFRREQRHGAL
jgi:hypothetical protein